MAIKIDLQDYCYACRKSDLFVVNTNEGQLVGCRNERFCQDLITRLRLDNLEKSVDKLKENENEHD